MTAHESGSGREEKTRRVEQEARQWAIEAIEEAKAWRDAEREPMGSNPEDEARRKADHFAGRVREKLGTVMTTRLRAGLDRPYDPAPTSQLAAIESAAGEAEKVARDRQPGTWAWLDALEEAVRPDEPEGEGRKPIGRLEVMSEGNQDYIRMDRDRYAVSQEGAAILKVLIEAGGEYVTGAEMGGKSGLYLRRTDRTMKKLPTPIRSAIETDRRGSRIRIAWLT